jgi:REP element-mobilizing transposase RayT
MIHQRIRKANEIDLNTGWHSRGYLPHFDNERLIQFVTFRLADSLPANFLQQLKRRLASKQITAIEYHREVERFLDQGRGPLHLGMPNIATIVEENLLRFHGHKYELFHWVIMPNHAHITLQPLAGFTLSSILQSMKSYTASAANKALGRSGPFWSIESYDRYIRDGHHFSNTVRYIHLNPVKARLCERANDWAFGCARRHEE